MRALRFCIALSLTAAPFAAYGQARDLLSTPLPPPTQTIQEQAAKQDKGNFGDLRQIPPAGAIQEAWDVIGGDEAVLWAKDPNKRATKVRLREGMTTTFWMPAKEPIEEFVLADNQNFGAQKCSKTPHCLYLWPKNTGFDSNLTIVTKKGAYTFYFRSYSIASHEIPHLKVMVGSQAPEVMPDGTPAIDNAPGAKASAKPQASAPADAINPTDAPEWVASDEYDPTTIAFDLQMTGDKEIAPVNVWRDSRFTWLDYNDKRDPKDWPAVWRVVDGVDEPVRIRKTKDNRFLIVEATGPLTLIKGEKVVCIRPKG